MYISNDCKEECNDDKSRMYAKANKIKTWNQQSSNIQHIQNICTLAAKQGKYLVPVFPLTVSLLLTAPHFSHYVLHSHTIQCISLPSFSPWLSQAFFWMSTKRNMISCLYRRQPKTKVRTVLSPKQYIVPVSFLSSAEPCARALLLQAATSGATALKVGVGWGPVVTVYESYVCVFNALIPGQSPVLPLAHHSCCGS